MSQPLYINVRFLKENLTGVGRFGYEVSLRLKKALPQAVFLGPKGISDHYAQELGIQTFGRWSGVLWEQVELPFYLKGKGGILLNLANTCPILYSQNVTVIHDIIPITNPEWFSFQARNYYKYISPLSIRHSKHLLTVSEQTKQEISKLFHIDPNKIDVVYNATSDFWKKDMNSESPEFPFILGVSSLDPRKNLKRLVEAFCQLNNKELRLVIVGHKHKAFPDLNIHLKEEEEKRILFKGYLTDQELRLLYSRAELFVFPSLKEGFGIPPLEAMKCGCPVVASNIPSINEVCGDAVLYINPLDASSLARGMQQVLDDSVLKEKMVQKGNQRASLFNWDSTSHKIVALLSSII